MSADLDDSELGREADARLRAFQVDISARAGVFHNLITLPTFHLTAKSMDELSRGYFGEDRMKAYVATVQREEIRRGVSAVKHQHEVGSDLGDTFKEMVVGRPRPEGRRPRQHHEPVRSGLRLMTGRHPWRRPVQQTGKCGANPRRKRSADGG